MMVFRKGKDVCLKSGGPRMTVEEITKDGMVVCNYISNNGEFSQKTFKPQELEYAERFRFIPEEYLD